MKAEQAIREALEMLAAHGIQSGDVYENLERSLEALKTTRKALAVALATRGDANYNAVAQHAELALDALNEVGGMEARARGN